jgi:hypothetical protein
VNRHKELSETTSQSTERQGMPWKLLSLKERVRGVSEELKLRRKDR